MRDTDTLTRRLFMNESNEKMDQVIQKIKENVIDQIDDYRSIMKSYFALPFPEEYRKLDIIYAHMNTIVRGLINTQFNQRHLKIIYSEDEISEMVNEIICYYLLAWIELSANTRQTIPSFSKQRYELSENQVRHKSGEDTYETKGDDMSSIYRGLAIYQTITFENISHLKNEISNTTRYKTYNFLELCFAECYSHYYINLLRYLAYYKEPLKIISNTKKQTAIEDGYKQYFLFLDDIKNEKDDRVFVIKSLLFYKFEYSFRFLFAYQTCEYRINNGISAKRKLPKGLDYYYKNFDRSGYVLGRSISYLQRHNQCIIQSAHKYKIDDKTELKIFYARIIMDKAIAIYKETSPFNITDNWTEEDFRYAAYFLKNRYKILDVIGSKNEKLLLEDVKSISKFIKEFYLQSKLIDEERLIHLRNFIKSQKDEKKKKSKSE